MLDTPFLMIPTTILEDDRISPEDLRVYIVTCGYCNEEEPPTMRMIQREIDIGPKTLKRSLQWLCACKLLRPEVREDDIYYHVPWAEYSPKSKGQKA